MKCLVTGANGFLGSALVRRLVSEGNQVTALLREGADARALEGVSCERATGDVTRRESLTAACAGKDVVFHLAGIRRASTRDAFLEVNTEGTRHVCEAMVEGGARRLVLASSLAASGPSEGGRPRGEDDPLAPTEWYGESKAFAEQLAFGFKDRLEVVAIRPCRILGPGDHENVTFFRLAKKGLVLKLLGPERRLSMVDVEDVVAHLLLLATRREAVGEAFFCASEETTTLEQLMRDVAGILGVRARTVPVPPGLLTAAGAMADVVANTTGRPLAVNRKLVRQVLSSWVCSVEKSKRLLGWAPKVRLRDSIQRSAESYLALGWL